MASPFLILLMNCHLLQERFSSFICLSSLRFYTPQNIVTLYNKTTIIPTPMIKPTKKTICSMEGSSIVASGIDSASRVSSPALHSYHQGTSLLLHLSLSPPPALHRWQILYTPPLAWLSCCYKDQRNFYFSTWQTLNCVNLFC